MSLLIVHRSRASRTRMKASLLSYFDAPSWLRLAEPNLICIFFLCSYLIIIKGLMPNVVESLYHVLTSPDTNPPPWMLNGGNWISIFMFVLVPLSFLRKLHSLRHTSYIALFAVGRPWFSSSPPNTLLNTTGMHSIPAGYRHPLLLLAHQEHACARRNQDHPFHPKLRINFPCAGVRIHLCPERK